MADFIIDHMVTMDNEVGLVEVSLWVLYFHRSVCSRGRGVGCVVVSPTGARFELAARLEFPCTNN
jgi:hypothetical protein